MIWHFELQSKMLVLQVSIEDSMKVVWLYADYVSHNIAHEKVYDFSSIQNILYVQWWRAVVSNIKE